MVAIGAGIAIGAVEDHEQHLGRATTRLIRRDFQRRAGQPSSVLAIAWTYGLRNSHRRERWRRANEREHGQGRFGERRSWQHGPPDQNHMFIVRAGQWSSRVHARWRRPECRFDPLQHRSGNTSFRIIEPAHALHSEVGLTTTMGYLPCCSRYPDGLEFGHRIQLMSHCVEKMTVTHKTPRCPRRK